MAKPKKPKIAEARTELVHTFFHERVVDPAHRYRLIPSEKSNLDDLIEATGISVEEFNELYALWPCPKGNARIAKDRGLVTLQNAVAIAYATLYLGVDATPSVFEDRTGSLVALAHSAGLVDPSQVSFLQSTYDPVARYLIAKIGEKAASYARKRCDYTPIQDAQGRVFFISYGVQHRMNPYFGINHISALPPETLSTIFREGAPTLQGIHWKNIRLRLNGRFITQFSYKKAHVGSFTGIPNRGQ